MIGQTGTKKPAVTPPADAGDDEHTVLIVWCYLGRQTLETFFMVAEVDSYDLNRLLKIHNKFINAAETTPQETQEIAALLLNESGVGFQYEPIRDTSVEHFGYVVVTGLFR